MSTELTVGGLVSANQLKTNEHPRETTDQVSNLILENRWRPYWWIGFMVAGCGVMLLMYAITILFVRGVGIWGIRIPTGWGFAIVNFVWWIGIGHAGTFISAFLLLLRQNWRNSINRCAEAMTLFAVACAGLFPILHLGRPQVFWWLFPYPTTMRLGPQFRSPLMWDVFAVSTYASISALFWFLGLLPDLATMRDRAKNPIVKRIYGVAAMGWRGSSRHWKHFETASLLLAGLATPLVISVHSIVSLDFTAGIVPGWHSTIFPPFFVSGALYSGFAMVMTILIPIRKPFGIQNLVTDDHLDKMALMMLVTGTIVGYGYLSEMVVAFYSGDLYDIHMTISRFTTNQAPWYWLMLILNLVIPQLLWFPSVRRNTWLLFGLCLLVNVGMWLERFIIVVTSTAQDFLPSSWRAFEPTKWDWFTYVGTLGLFFTLLFLFVRFLPLLSMNEVKQQNHKLEEGAA